MLWKEGCFAILTEPLYIGCGETIAKKGDTVRIAKDKKVKGPFSRVFVFISKEDEEKNIRHLAFSEDLANTTPINCERWT